MFDCKDGNFDALEESYTHLLVSFSVDSKQHKSSDLDKLFKQSMMYFPRLHVQFIKGISKPPSPKEVLFSFNDGDDSIVSVSTEQ